MERTRMTHLDGNALAGRLAEIFRSDVTSASGRCRGCGTVTMIGDTMVYATTSGFDIRCPHCDDVLATLTESKAKLVLRLSGVTALTPETR